MMDENKEEKREQNSSSAIKIGKEAANEAKNVNNAIKSAATGNVAAAATSFSRTKISKFIVGGIICFLSIIILFLYALPISIYEAVESYYDEVKETWVAEYYSGESTGISSFIAATGVTTSNIFLDILNKIKSQFTSDNMENDSSNSVSDYEMQVTQVEESEKNTLNDKLDVCINKLKIREDQIEESITNQTGAINNYFMSKYASNYDVWDGTNIAVFSSNTGKGDGIKLLCLYTVIHGGSINDIKLSELAKWLGVKKSIIDKKTYFDIGGGIQGSVDTWYGEFLPQYLFEQRKVEIEKNPAFESEINKQYEKYMCPAVDLMLIVDCSDFDTATPIVTYEKESVLDEEGNPVLDEEGNPVINKISHACMNISISISVRSLDNLYELVGLWEGPLDEKSGYDDNAIKRHVYKGISEDDIITDDNSYNDDSGSPQDSGSADGTRKADNEDDDGNSDYGTPRRWQ